MQEIRSKSTVYVGNLSQAVDAKTINAAFIPFGEIIDVHLPKDLRSAIGAHKGHAYVEYESQDDAASAMDNMHLSEMYGNVIKVVNARGMKLGEFMTRPVWEDERYLADMAQNELEKKEEAQDREREALLENGFELPPALVVDTPKLSMINPRVYFDISIGGIAAGRILMELRADVVPLTTENFRMLCTHDKANEKNFHSFKGYGYRKSVFHRIIPQFMCQGGDFTRHNG